MTRLIIVGIILCVVSPVVLLVIVKLVMKERKKGMMNYKEMVYETSVKEIEKLNGLTDDEIKRNPHILKS